MGHAASGPGPARRGRLARLLAGAGLLAGVALPAGLPAPAAAAGAWQTFLRARDFTDLVVTDEAVWCATAEAGLWRFDRLERRFTSIAREPGSIASNHLTSLVVDRVGRLWVGTFASGVSRLSADGSVWELVNAFDGLPTDSVTTMKVMGDTLWIGTRRGIALWDGRQILGSLPDGNTVSFDTTFATPAITGIEQLGDTLWLATPRGVGFARTSTNLTDWRKLNEGLPSLAVDRLASDGGTLFAQVEGGLYRWRPDSLHWRTVGFIGNVSNLRSERGAVLVATDRGILRNRAGTALFDSIALSPRESPSVRFDPEPSVDPGGSRHYAGNTAGLWEQPAVPGDPWTLHPPPGPPGNTYANIVIDGSNVYAATRFEGIGRYDGSGWFSWLPVFCGNCPDTFRNPTEVFAMLADPTGLKWVACWSSALERFDDSVLPHQFTHLWTGPGDEFRHTLAFGAAADSNGGRWFGMDTNNLGVVDPLGLDFYDSTGTHAGTWGPGSPAGVSLVRNGKIRALTVDKAGRIWVGYAGATNSGVDHFVRRPEVGYDFRTVANTTSFDIWSLVARGDSIWVLTDRDLRRISRTTVPPRLVERHDTPAGRPLGMRLMDVAPNGEVFVGSEEGVRWYRGDGTTQDFTAANSALASNDVRAVAVDRATGVVWFGTAGGLNRFDPLFRPGGIPPDRPDSLRVYPNPATLTGLGVQLRLQGAAAGYVGGIYDLRGRLLHRFATSSRGQVFWDGRDRDGVPVKPGVYFVRAEGEGRLARARFVLLH